MKRVYLDYAATTPVAEQVVKAMSSYFSEKFGNTMSLHSFGQEAKAALEQSRQRAAGLIKAKSSEIIFTSSATESNNMVLKGIKYKHIIISSIEHDCIAETAKRLEKQGLPAGRQGIKITKIPVNKQGLVNPERVLKAITKDTGLVSIIHASNEIGTIQPIKEIGKICREKGVLFHTDASQSFGKIPIDVNEMNVDLLTASSHKIYGPKGAALLFIKQGVKIEPLLHGGGQENGLRSSTVNTAAVVGFAKACEIAKKEMAKDAEKQARLRDKIIKQVLNIKGAFLTGDPEKRLPNNASFYFSFVEGESVVLQLDLAGIAASTGSACSSKSLEPSHVLLAIGLKPEQAHGSLRVSLGRQTTEEEIDYFLKVLPGVIKKLRKISPFK
ncbi:cysteine desulfurase [Parcubacteria bacterium DG_72]|nr:MAG: cysteine desulfurase [Parcubacteria bacterium DG_72]